MKVELYADEEILQEIDSGCTERAELAEAMGLPLQKEVLFAGFRQMTALEVAVFGTVFPQRTALADFRAEAIPVRALKHIKRAKDSNVFERIEIWHPTVIIDPLAVAMIKDPKETWRTIHVMLCRWGTSLEEFPALLKQALAMQRERLSLASNMVLQKATAQVEEVKVLLEANDIIDMSQKQCHIYHA